MMDQGDKTLEVMYDYGLIGFTDKIMTQMKTDETFFIFWCIMLFVAGIYAYRLHKKHKYNSMLFDDMPTRLIAKDFNGSPRIITNKGYTQFRDCRLMLDKLRIPRDPDGLPYILQKNLTPFKDYDLMEAEKKAGAQYHYVRRPKGVSVKRKGNASQRISGQENLNG